MVTKAKMKLEPLEIELEATKGKKAGVIQLLETTVKNLRESPYTRITMSLHIKAES